MKRNHRTVGTRQRGRSLLLVLVLLLALGAVGGAFAWYKFFREEPQPEGITNDRDMRFKYGSIGAERDAGIPYWIFYVLPRVFPDLLPGPGGYASFGVVWEEGQELPAGFSKKVVGFPRVANNCASCHGQVHPLKEAPGFAHTDRFVLEGGHAGLTCDKCHGVSGPDSVAVLRVGTFEVRECVSCHKDPHAGSLGRDCASCHGTALPFDRAAQFKHTDAFPLKGGHSNLACKDCHEQTGPRSVASLKLRPLASRECAECHRSPHRAAMVASAAVTSGLTQGASCIECHKVEDRTFLAPAATMTPAQHAAAGFPLDAPHNQAACADCHAGVGSRQALKPGPDLAARFARRYPGRAPDACAACHRDPHEGQFGAGATKGRCIACHDPAHFTPSAFTLASHAQTRFPLTGAHKAVGCNLCHKKEGELVRFVPTSTACADCHRDNGPSQRRRRASEHGERTWHDQPRRFLRYHDRRPWPQWYAT